MNDAHAVCVGLHVFPSVGLYGPLASLEIVQFLQNTCRIVTMTTNGGFPKLFKKNWAADV